MVGFAILGPSSYCIERLRRIASQGLSRLVLIGPSAGSDAGDAAAAMSRLVAEVLPALR